MIASDRSWHPPGVPREPKALADRWLATSAGLSWDVRIAFLRSEAQARTLAEVAEAVDRVCVAAEQAEPRALALRVALVDWLLAEDATDLAQRLREEAAGRALLALARLLRRPLARTGIGSVPPRLNVPDYGGERPLSLGERRALARRPTRASLEQLLADPHPLVIRNLLANPKLVEDDVVRLAARRPARAEVLAEIAKNPRWAHRVRVRRAIVFNPWSPPEQAVPLVGLLARVDLVAVVAAPDLPVHVRAAALELLERRPPHRARPGKPTLQ